MIKILFLLGLANAVFFLLGFLIVFNGVFIGFGSDDLFDALFFPTLVSGGLAFVLSPLITLVYLWGKHKQYSYSRIEIFSFRLNLAILGLAIIGFLLGNAVGGGMM